MKALVFLFVLLLSFQSLGEEFRIPLKKGLLYEKVKPFLLSSGWIPVQFKDREGLDLQEMEYCQNGIGRCAFWLTSGNGKYLAITTTNDGYEILSWRKERKLPTYK